MKAAVELAVNANFFARLEGIGLPALGWTEGLPVDLLGLSRSEGRSVSPPRLGEGNAAPPDPALLIDEVSGGRCPCVARVAAAGESDLAGIEDAVAGLGARNGNPGTLLVENGENRGGTAQVAPAQRHPRTAAGVSRDGRTLLLLVVDGRQPGWSIGATLPELAQMMIEAGAWNAVNLDGGGSSAMWYRAARRRRRPNSQSPERRSRPACRQPPWRARRAGSRRRRSSSAALTRPLTGPVSSPTPEDGRRASIRSMSVLHPPLPPDPPSASVVPARRMTDVDVDAGTVIGPGTRIRGTLSGGDPVDLAGVLEGPSNVTGLYRVREGARVAGDIVATSLLVEGDVSGRTLAAQNIEIGASRASAPTSVPAWWRSRRAPSSTARSTWRVARARRPSKRSARTDPDLSSRHLSRRRRAGGACRQGGRADERKCLSRDRKRRCAARPASAWLGSESWPDAG